jgi:plastocyanin
MTRMRGLAVSATTILALLPFGPAALAAVEEASKAHNVSVTVTAKDYSFSLSTKTAAVGKVAFSVKNSGKKDHNFQINGKKTSVLKPGKSATLTVTFGKAGSYSYSSTVADDAKKGMKGTFTAKDVSAGKKVYGSTGCGACHTFKAAGTTGKVGPNLDKSKTSRSTIESVITKGKGTMPSYKGQLTSKQIDDVSDFVFYSRTG